MDKNGKKIDVIIEERYYKDDTGLRMFGGLRIWADKGMEDIIKNIPGVHSVMEFGGTLYHVDLDPRYDKNFLIDEIEAQIKIHMK